MAALAIGNASVLADDNNDANSKDSSEKSDNSVSKTVFSLSTGVEGNNNNLQTIVSGGTKETVDTNWKFDSYYDSYGLTRGMVFGNSVSDPNGRIGYNISSAKASAASLGNADTSAYVITGGNRPGWYNPGTGAQWLGPSNNEQNGGTPINPPGNYEFSLDLSKYINKKGGLVTVSIADINADNHYELAVGGSVQEMMDLVKPFATQETWNVPGNKFTFTFSPADGTTLDLILANANDQLNGGKYSYQKNPTGFLISGMTVSQASGPTPAADKMVWKNTVVGAVVAGSGTVYSHNLVAAPEPGQWLLMGSFLAITSASGMFKRRSGI